MGADSRRAVLVALILMVGSETGGAVAGTGTESSLAFSLGRALFDRVWVAAPASTDSADGLGPLYNARSCRGCHPKGGRGRAPDPGGARIETLAPASLVLRLSVPASADRQGSGLAINQPRSLPEPRYGEQIQPLGLPGQVPEGRVAVRYLEQEVQLGDGERVRLNRPEYRVRDLGYGPMHPETRTSPRLAPRLLGLGPLEGIPEGEILARSDPQDEDGDGISGRPNLVWAPSLGRIALGRYGWKAGEASLEGQVQAAFSRDLGIGTPLHPAGAGDCTEAQPRCRAAPDGSSVRHGGVEAGEEITGLVAHFVRSLPVPERRDSEGSDVLQGKASFRRIGCAGCHRPELSVQEPTELTVETPAESRKQARPYTDLLLHDMGEGLADHCPDGQADGHEWRTPPLWGIGSELESNAGVRYLHDGRARSLTEAILWHQGEAARSRHAFARLSARERTHLLRFLRSL